MRYRDFFNPRKPKTTQAQARLAAGLAAADPRWAGPSEPLTRGARPHPLFSNLTESEIDLSLALLHGRDEFDPR